MPAHIPLTELPKDHVARQVYNKLVDLLGPHVSVCDLALVSNAARIGILAMVIRPAFDNAEDGTARITVIYDPRTKALETIMYFYDCSAALWYPDPERWIKL